MKIGVCVSNENSVLRGMFTKILQKRINESEKEWSSKFAEILDKKNIEYGYIYMDKDNWINQVDDYEILIWKPKFMGIQSSQFFKEKVYFVQHILNKRIYPNFETVWHFDSKVAQKYILEYNNIDTPKTFVSFDYNEIQKIIEDLEYPIVSKSSNGAGSTGVKLVKSKKELMKKVNHDFVWKKVINKIFKTNYDRYGYLYLQEFIENNDCDLRINIIGYKYAVGFWRMNRKNDFRASGSGIINYDKEIPKEVITYCANISKLNKFDSMAYDILFKGNKFQIVEMSYGYVDTAVYNAKGYYVLDENGQVEHFREGNYWPQELWIEWIIQDSF